MAETESSRTVAVPLVTRPSDALPVPAQWTGAGGERAYQAVRLETLVERQAERTPDAVALRHDGSTITYAALTTRARRLARCLLAKGVGRNDLVVLYLTRSVEQIVAVLGIMMAGAAYVPIDPATPPERRRLLLDDARARAIVTDAVSATSLSESQRSASVILGGSGAEGIEGTASDDALPTWPVTDVAYVIYTSGSTGFPKGVLNQHDAVSNHIAWMREAFPLTGRDVVLGKTPAVFDVSVWEWFWTLSQGACLALAKPGGERDPRYLVDTIEEQGITSIQFVPTLLRLFLGRPDLSRCRTLQRVFCSGEALTADLRDEFFSRMPGPPALVDLYGPTEAAVHVTGWVCQPGEQGAVPIGRPLPNVRAYIVDDAQKPVGVGVKGELLIGGIQVARGYLRRDDLTRERFIADPFAADESARCYRTGDCVAWRPDGAIDYFGRFDSQVQLGGVRVELGEIEAALRRHPAVSDAAVVHNEEPRGSRLVAYLRRADRERSDPAVDTIRGHLAGLLPEYMIPARYLWIDQLPVTSTGKLDRAALPDPDAFRPSIERAFEPPRSATEQRLARLWADELQLDRVGRDDDFNLLGGDSLAAVRLFEAIHQVFGVDLPLSDLMIAPTVATLAARIDAASPSAAVDHASLVILREGAGGHPLYLPPSMGGELLYWREFVQALPAGRAVYGFGLPRDLTGMSDLRTLAAAFVRELVAFQPEGPYHLAGYSFSAAVAFEMAQQLRASGRDVGLLAMIDYGPGDDSTGRLRTLGLFVQNLPHWFRHDILESGAAVLAGRVKRKLRSIVATAFARRQADATGLATLAVEEMFGDRALPDSHRRLIIEQLAAFYEYEPRAYDGRVLLLFARCRPLFHSLAPDLGWTRLASGGVQRVVVGCNHDNILTHPHVRSVAGVIGDALNQAG